MIYLIKIIKIAIDYGNRCPQIVRYGSSKSLSFLQHIPHFTVACIDFLFHTFLLRASGRGTTLFVSPFGGAKLRTRLENILSFRRATRLSLAAFALFAGMLFYVSLTNAG